MPNPQRVLIDPDYTKIDLEVTPQPDSIIISDEVMQVLSWLFAWNNASNKWKALQADNSGRLLVSSGLSQSDTPTTSKATVDGSSSLILSANDDRLAVAIYNNGTETVYIKLGGSSASVNDFPIPNGGFFSTELFAGEIYAVTASGSSDVRILEFA